MFTFFKNWRLNNDERSPYNEKLEDLLYRWKLELMEDKK